MGRIYFIALILLLFSVARAKSAENTKPKDVKILTWWGYIDTNSKQVKAIEKKCNSKVILDEFYSNSEFLSRVSSKPESFDILIYSDTVFKSAQTAFISKVKSKISTKQDAYWKDIQNFFNLRSYGANTAVFQISLSGFLINKDLIQVTQTDPLSSFFKKANNHIVTLLDDHVEIATLLNKWECSELKTGCKESAGALFPSEEKLKKLVGQSKVVISSDLAEITKHPQFALAYTWSGDAIERLEKQKNLEFMIHPALSHTSMDLISLVGGSAEAKCVANEMSSKDFASYISTDSMYFSPYGPIDSKNPAYLKIQSDFFKGFSTLGRIHRVTQAESLEIEKKWNLFKIVFGSKI